MRLIDADALRAEFKDDERGLYHYTGIWAAIDAAPTIDAVPVVRCKDCRFCEKHPTSDKIKICTNEKQWVTESYPLVSDNDFCSHAVERKESQ